MNSESAETVGVLIYLRTVRAELSGTPFENLYAFGTKLLAAARRRRRSVTSITIWSIDRSEALAGFHFLALFFHPDAPDGLLSPKEQPAVQEVALELARVLTARPGPKRQSRADAEYTISTFEQRDNLPNDIEEPPEPYVKRLRERLAKEDAVCSTAVNAIPDLFLRLLS